MVSPPAGTPGGAGATKNEPRSVLMEPSTPPVKLTPTPIGGLGTAAPGVSAVRPEPVKSSGRCRISSPGSAIWPGRPSGNNTARGCEVPW